MGKKAGDDRVVVREGVYIHFRDSNVWHVYFKLKGADKAVRRSLNTTDMAEAKRLAEIEYDQARLRQQSGKPSLGIGFQKLCDGYLASLPDENPKIYHTDTIKRHLTPFFSKNVPDFSEITNGDVLDYIQWRRKKGKDGKEPKAATLNRENIVLNGLIKYAVTRGYLSKNDAPDVAALKTADSRRPNFTRDELKALQKKAKERIDEIKHGSHKEQRRLLYDWIAIMVNTGLRPAEAQSLTWGKVFIEQPEPYLHIKQGKTKPRDVVPLDTAVDHLKAIKARQEEFLKEHHKKLHGDDYVFSAADASTKSLKRVSDFKTVLNGLLKACSLKKRKGDLSWSAYGLRHTYATMRLEEGTNILLLAQNMGTSIKMIERYYGHVITRQQRDELTKMKSDQGKSAGQGVDMAAITGKFDAVVDALKKDKQETIHDVLRKEMMKEWIKEYGHAPDGRFRSGELDIFEGMLIQKMKELGVEEFYVRPDDLPDDLPD